MRLAALIAAAAGLWFARDALLPAGPGAADSARAVVPARSAPAQALTPTDADVCTVPATMPERGLFAAAFDQDPFTGPRPPAAPAARPAPPVPAFIGPPAPPPPAPPAPPPRAPYRFFGTLLEKGQPASVFLGLGEKLIQARVGDTLEGGYRLDGIAPRELTFMHLQMNVTVRMAVDGDPS
jgi:hypothetical protein